MVKNLVLENKKPVELVQEIEKTVQEVGEKIIETTKITCYFPNKENQAQNKKSITSVINPKKMWAGISYIGSPDSNIWDELDKNLTSDHNKHRGNSPFNHFCLGCLVTGGKYSGNAELNFTKTFQFSSGGRLVLETSESGNQELIIPSQGGVVKLEVKGNEVSLVLEDRQNLQQLQSREEVDSAGGVLYFPEEEEKN